MSLDSDPTSLTGDPPAVAQPTLPPPPNPEDSASPIGGSNASVASRLARLRRPRIAFGILVAFASASVGLYVLLAPHTGDAKTSTTTTSHAVVAARPADLLVRIDRTMETVPAQSIDQACPEQDGRIPLVLYATPAARSEKTPTGLTEGAIFSSAIALHEVETKLASARRIGVIRTMSIDDPRASVGLPSPGRYEGQLVIIDTSSGAALCHTKLVAWSSSIVDQPGVAERALRDDFSDRVHSAFSESGSRLRVDLEL